MARHSVACTRLSESCVQCPLGPAHRTGGPAWQAEPCHAPVAGSVSRLIKQFASTKDEWRKQPSVTRTCARQSQVPGRRRARGVTGGGPQSWRRPAAWYDGLRHRLWQRTQSAPDGPRRPAGPASRRRPAGGRPRADRPGRPPGRPGRWGRVQPVPNVPCWHYSLSFFWM